MALSQGLMNKLIADVAPPALRGTAFGVFNLVGGVALLLASAVAGALWQRWGAPATFVAGGTFALSAALGLLAVRVRGRGDAR
jgi:MFS family permease